MIVNDGGSSSSGTTSTSDDSSSAAVESLDPGLMPSYSDATDGVDFGLCCAIGAVEGVDIASLIGKLGTYN